MVFTRLKELVFGTRLHSLYHLNQDGAVAIILNIQTQNSISIFIAWVPWVSGRENLTNLWHCDYWI